MAMPITVRRFTVDELDWLPDDGNRYELLDGLLLVTPGPGMPHQTVATRLATLLGSFLAEEPTACVWAPGSIILRPHVRLEPDVLVGVVAPGSTRWEDVSGHWLAVEVSGPGSLVYDREYKRDGYLDLGVREVWRIDLVEQLVFVSRPGEQKDQPVEGSLTWRSPGSGREVVIELGALFRNVPPGE